MTEDLFGDLQDDTILAHLDNPAEDTSRFPALLAELNDLLRGNCPGWVLILPIHWRLLWLSVSIWAVVRSTFHAVRFWTR